MSQQIESAECDQLTTNQSNSENDSGISNNEKNDSDLVRPERRRSGRPKSAAEEFTIFDETDPKRAKYMCCKDVMHFIVWTSRSVLNHFLSVTAFAQKPHQDMKCLSNVTLCLKLLPLKNKGPGK